MLHAISGSFSEASKKPVGPGGEAKAAAFSIGGRTDFCSLAHGGYSVPESTANNN
jgi:hypothetical protein